MIELRQSTAGQEVPLGYFVDNTDGDTEETTLTISNTDIKIWKWGATTLENKNNGGATHISNGIYYATLDDTDTDTLGPLVIFVHESGALTVRLECAVVTANYWDSKYAADNLQVDAVQIEGADATDQINAACDVAIETYHLDHLLAADYDPTAKPGVATALLNELVENDGGVSRFTENALEQAPSGGGGSATLGNQNTIITHLTDIKGDGWISTDSLENISGDVDTISSQVFLGG